MQPQHERCDVTAVHEPDDVKPCEFRSDAARAILRGLMLSGGTIVTRARSPHASDCSVYCTTGDDLQLKREFQRPIHDCRCMRAMRIVTPRNGTWLLCFGDQAEGGQIVLRGPYHADQALTYGGGFWLKVAV